MSSSRALCCLPSVKKQKNDFQVCFLQLLIYCYLLSHQAFFQFFTYCLMLKFFLSIELCAADLYTVYSLTNKLPVPLTVVTIFFRTMHSKTIIRFAL